MANRYWVGGTGNWHSAANWSTSSGGSGGAGIPTSSDDVYIDGFGSNVISLGSNVGLCRDMAWSNYFASIDSTNALGGLRCYGTWNQVYNSFGPPFRGTLTGTGILGFLGGSVGVPVPLGDVSSAWPISVQGFYSTNTTFASDSSILLGVSNASANSFFDSSATSLYASDYFFRGGTINIGDLYLSNYTASGTVLTVNASVGVWKPVITHTGSFYTAQAGGRTASLDFYLGSGSNQKININSDIMIGYGIKIYAEDGVTSQLGTLNISVSGEPIIFEAGKTHVIDTFTLPSGFFPNSFSSTSSGTRYTLQSGITGQTLSFSDLGVQDSIATGATYWNAFTSNGCVDNGNNVNWNFSPASVGGGGRQFMQFF